MAQDSAGAYGTTPAAPPSIVNDFSIVVATVNGTGSQTANQALLRALLKMGIPVSGKNIFPSNIQGAPTWYFIRASYEGYVGRRLTSEILVAFNPSTVDRDVRDLPPGGVCIYNDDWRQRPGRDDVTFYPIPVNRFLRETGVKGKLRDYVANMVYVGALAHLLGIPLANLEASLDRLLGGKAEAVGRNMAVIRQAHSWTADNLTKRDPFTVAPMAKEGETIVITGNEAAALGAVFGGVTLAAWYPITPSTSLIDALNKYLPRLRRDPQTGKATYAVIQAEDELAAIGMVLGGGWAGARAMTATSGPGISLMSEFAGMGYFAEIPAVIWDVQRVGPSTGLPTRTSQGDVLSTYYLGHGDTKNVLLFPATVKECFEFGASAFDLADTLQTPIFVMSDLDLGMNHWLSEPFEYPAESINRGKVLTAEQIGANGYARYRDSDGDGIGYRTLPGNPHPLAAWLARGTGHNEAPDYSEKPKDYLNNMSRLDRKFETAARLAPAPVIDLADEAEVGLIAYGSTLAAIEEARDKLASQGISTSFMRLRALPLHDDVRQFINRYDRHFVIELNYQGQMHKIMQTELPELATRLVSLAHIDGLPLTADWVIEQVTLHLMATAANGG